MVPFVTGLLIIIEVGEKSIVVAARSFTPQRSKELNKVHVLPAAQADLKKKKKM